MDLLDSHSLLNSFKVLNGIADNSNVFDDLSEEQKIKKYCKIINKKIKRDWVKIDKHFNTEKRFDKRNNSPSTMAKSAMTSQSA